MNETAFSITWEPPEDTGGRSDVYYDIECSAKCPKTDEKCSGYCDVLKDQFQDKRATRFSATGLQSTATYTILIFAKNGVSEVAKETNKPLSITVFAGKKQNHSLQNLYTSLGLHLPLWPADPKQIPTFIPRRKYSPISEWSRKSRNYLEIVKKYFETIPKCCRKGFEITKLF